MIDPGRQTQYIPDRTAATSVRRIDDRIDAHSFRVGDTMTLAVSDGTNPDSWVADRPGWLPCVGRTYFTNDWPRLFEKIGNRWGGSLADGTFVVPLLQYSGPSTPITTTAAIAMIMKAG